MTAFQADIAAFERLNTQVRIAFFIDMPGVVRLVVDGMSDNSNVLADIERILR